MPKIAINGAGIYYEVSGEGQPILGIHGTPSSAVLWEDAARELSRLGRCIIYDRRGFQRSRLPRPPETLDLAEHVNDAAALLDAVAAIPAVVIGRSTGGLIALELGRRHPAKVKALVLLEPAVFAVDVAAAAWADRLRHQVLQASSTNPSSASEVVLRVALADEGWESLPDELKELFTDVSSAVLAEIRGRGLDLSAQPFNPTGEDLASIHQPALIVSSEDSPEVLRRVNQRLSTALPHAETVLVPGGHTINPAHASVQEFIRRILNRSSP